MTGQPKMPAHLTAVTHEQVDWLPGLGQPQPLAPAYAALDRAAGAAMDQLLAGLSEAEVERACNAPLLWEGDQA